MIKFLKKVAFIIILFFMNSSFSQQMVGLKEKAILKTNKTDFVVGETIYYQLLINEQPSEANITVKIALVNSKGETFFKQQLKDFNKKVEGNIFISSNLITGNYKITGTIKDTKNDKIVSSITKNIHVVNPFSKKTGFPEEYTKLIANKEVFVAGETIYYKLFVFYKETNSFSDLSKMSYIYLVNPDKKIVFKQKLKTANGSSYGDVFLPSNLKTGNYKLVAVTQNSQNNKIIDSGIQDVYIINPFLSSHFFVADADTITIKKDTNFILTNKLLGTFKTRQKVNFSKKQLNLKKTGNFTISVKKMDSIKEIQLFKNVIHNNVNQNILPELRGELLSGVLFNKTSNKPLQNETVTLSILNNPTIYKNVATNSKGKFYFNLYEDYLFGNLLLNTDNLQKVDSLRVVLDQKTLLFKDKLSFKNVVLDKNLAGWLKKKSIETQIENIYYKSKEDNILPIRVDSIFYKGLNTRYVLDDYKRFETVKETFTEIIPIAYERERKGIHQFYVRFFDEALSVYASKFEPLILIDGIQILNQQILYDYDAYQIKYIDVTNKLYFYGPKVYGGVISVRTTKGNYKPKLNEVIYNKEFKAPFPKTVYFQPNYNNESTALKRIPDFRTQLYWNPNFEGKEITFFTSDVVGLYEISIEGYTKEGVYVSNKKFFKVD